MRAATVKCVLAAALVQALAAAACAEPGDDQFAVAAGHYAARRWQLAAEEFQRFQNDFPGHAKLPKATFFLGETLVQLGKHTDALAQFAAVLEAEPNGRYARQALFRSGECAFLTDKADQARATLAKFLEQHSDDPLNAYVLSYLGELALRARDYEAAKTHFSDAVDRFADGPTGDDCRLGLAQAHLGLQEYRQAEEALKGLLDAERMTVEANYWLGQVFKAEQQWDNSAKAFQTALAADPAHKGAAILRYQAGESLFRAKAFQAAIDVLCGDDEPEAIESLPATHRYLIALAQQGLRRHEEALATLDGLAAVADQELVGNALLAKATSLLALDRQRDAIGPLTTYLAAPASTDDSRRGRAIAQLALCYARDKEFDRATTTLAQLASSQEHSELYWTTTLQLAQLAAAAQQTDAARSLFESASESAPDEIASQSLAGLAQLLAASDELDGAVGCYERLLQKYPDGAQAAAAALACARLRERLEQFDAALAMHQLVIERHSESEHLPQALLGAASLYDRLSQEAKAIEHYARLMRDFSDSDVAPAAIYGWAWCLRELKRDAEANQKFEQLRRDYPKSQYWADAIYRLALFAAQAKQFEQAIALLGELIEATDVPTETLEHGLYLRAQVAITLEKWADADKDLERLIEKHRHSALALPAEFLRADVAYRHGDYEQAGERFAAIEPRLEGRKERWVPMVTLRRAQVLAQQKRWSEVRQIVESIEEKYPNFDQQFEADYLIGRACAAEANLDEARKRYQRVVLSPQGGKSETAAMAQWMIGESYLLQEQYTAAIREYLRVEVLYAYPHWQAAALLQAGKCYEQLGKWKNAGDLYSRLLKQYAQTEFASEASERLQAVRAQTASRSK